MTRHLQRDEVRPDIGDMRVEDETCVEENYKDETSTWTQFSRLRHCCGDLQGQDIDVVIYKDETSLW